MSLNLDLNPSNLPSPEVLPASTELIYFLLTDRFHSGNDLFVSTELYGNTNSIHQLAHRMGGTLRGVISQLDYLKKLGVTSIWLSPVMENIDDGYHGYATRNFLNVDPRLGTLQDLKELVARAHEQSIRIYLDIVLNHTANVWEYAEGEPVYNGNEFTFSHWKDEQFPIPSELRSPDFFVKKGRIVNWDSYPETREGDMFELRKLRTDGSEQGKKVREILFIIYAWWIKETNADGFRVDTIKHLSPGTVAFFCEQIRAYAKSLGKNNFTLFGEAIGSYSLFRHYCKQRVSNGARIKGLDKLLDFPLHFVLPEVVKGALPVSELLRILKQREKFLADMNGSESMLIGFLDNHDQVAQTTKARVHAQLNSQDVEKAYLLLHFISKHVQLYYGTEQGLCGAGNSDVFVREPMFDERTSLHDDRTGLYLKLQQVHRWKSDVCVFFEYPLQVKYENGVLELRRQTYREDLVLLYNFTTERRKRWVGGRLLQILWRISEVEASEEVELGAGAVGIFRLVR